MDLLEVIVGMGMTMVTSSAVIMSSVAGFVGKLAILKGGKLQMARWEVGQLATPLTYIHYSTNNIILVTATSLLRLVLIINKFRFRCSYICYSSEDVTN